MFEDLLGINVNSTFDSTGEMSVRKKNGKLPSKYLRLEMMYRFTGQPRVVITCWNFQLVIISCKKFSWKGVDDIFALLSHSGSPRMQPNDADAATFCFLVIFVCVCLRLVQSMPRGTAALSERVGRQWRYHATGRACRILGGAEVRIEGH